MNSKSLLFMVIMLLTLYRPAVWAQCAEADPPECRDAYSEDNTDKWKEELVGLAIVSVVVIGVLAARHLSEVIVGEELQAPQLEPQSQNNLKVNFFANQNMHTEFYGLNVEYKF